MLALKKQFIGQTFYFPVAGKTSPIVLNEKLEEKQLKEIFAVAPSLFEEKPKIQSKKK